MIAVERQPYNVLFLCADNRVLSIMAESMLNHLGVGRFNAFSGGLHPSGSFDNRAIAVLRRAGYLVERSEPASWREFAWIGAPALNLVIALGEAGGRKLEINWNGTAPVLRWQLPRPCDVAVASALSAYSLKALYRMLENRISVLVNLPDQMLERVMRAKEQDASVRHAVPAAADVSDTTVMSDQASRLRYGRRRTDRRVPAAA